jgi:hypothetical protein
MKSSVNRIPNCRLPEQPWQNSPTAWFAALERSLMTSDRKLEERAREELRRLGVSVVFERLPAEVAR